MSEKYYSLLRLLLFPTWWVAIPSLIPVLTNHALAAKIGCKEVSAVNDQENRGSKDGVSKNIQSA